LIYASAPDKFSKNLQRQHCNSLKELRMEERTLLVRRQGRHLLRGLKLCITFFIGFSLLTLSAAIAATTTQQSSGQSIQSSSSYPQYTEGACILIAAQIKRFEQQQTSHTQPGMANFAGDHSTEDLPWLAELKTR
jgi:hypothetical protein